LDAYLEIYRRLFDHYGPQGWWPGETAFEVMVGAILTQAVAWANVEKALANLKRAGLLTPTGLRQLSVEELAQLIRPASYNTVKARRLRAFVDFLWEGYDGDLTRLLSQEQEPLRQQLLSVYGIGPETADSIVLYAAGKPSFVVDAYTRRILHRLGLAEANAPYDDLRSRLMDSLPQEVPLFQEYHALLVRLGKEVCRPRPRCGACPLADLCPGGGQRIGVAGAD
jgi:endonuclease-3 related protein